ncbi:hypothetical protein PGT21_016012 [Puccinia graminis f. sp. tritici]|uniref:Uncharacterized protein n=1 Tax=Puccinia graminis f. sp. tritici TaxID=56615 RepID=A0A5B0PEU1_PUCGR|nr:hypothetical protein PGT21_016012 [Puccinia graminis f. sp. tritici]
MTPPMLRPCVGIQFLSLALKRGEFWVELSCSVDEHAIAKLKACDQGEDINDVITLDDDDHRSSNSNNYQASASCIQLIDRISPPKTDLLSKNKSS